MTTPHNMDALTFKAENQPLDGEPAYNEAVEALAAKIKAGEITLDEAKATALDTLIGEVFPDKQEVRNSFGEVTDEKDYLGVPREFF